MKLLLEISYVGTAYCGYQVQQSGNTIQAELNKATELLFGHPCDIVGCSRTDSGVHAKRYYVTVTKKGTKTLEPKLDVSRIPLALTTHLPEDMAVLRACLVDESFHPRYNVIQKTYQYRMLFRSVRDPFLKETTWHVPFGTKPDRLERMQKAASYLVGEHDFSSFMAAGSKIKDAVRTVSRATVFQEGDEIVLEISADGFLYHMVRIIAGTLVEVAMGRKEPTDIPAIIDGKRRKLAGPTAPPHALYLWAVEYPEGLVNL